MADNEHEGDTKDAKPADKDVETPHPATTASSATGAHSEWTVSDRRGPLVEAPGESDDERYVPAHELDAEGSADPMAANHQPAEPSTGAETPAPVAATHDDDPTSLGETLTTAAATGSPDEPKRSLWPVAAALIVGAVIGAGSAAIVDSQRGENGASADQVTALASRLDALEKRPDPAGTIAGLKRDVGDLGGKVAALQKAASPSPGTASGTTAAAPSPVPAQADAGLAGKLAALQATVDTLGKRTAALQSRDASSGTADKLAALQGDLAGARKEAASAQSGLDALKGQQKSLGDKLGALAAAVAGAQKEAAGAQSGIATVQDRQKTLEGKLGAPALAVVADSLVQQIDAGQPYARQVDALAALAADPAKVAVLRENAVKGVPSAQVLLAQFKPLADAVIATGNKVPADADFGQKLRHGLFGLVSVRRADETTGSDLSSKVALIQSDLAHDDVAGAYATWSALPADAKAKSQAWGALAKTSVEALDAARGLQHTAIDTLGGRKS